MSEQKEFLDWWDGDELSEDNPYREDSPLYWAWEGFLVGLRVEREACASLLDAMTTFGFDGHKIAEVIRARADNEF